MDESSPRTRPGSRLEAPEAVAASDMTLFSLSFFCFVEPLLGCGVDRGVGFNRCLPVQQIGFSEEGFALLASPLFLLGEYL